MDNNKILHSLVSLVSVDGKLEPQEMQFLQNTAQRLGIPDAELNQLIEKVRGGQAKLHIPGDTSQIRQMFDLMVQASVADGQVDVKEKKVLELVAGKAGMSATQASNVIDRQLQQAIAEAEAVSTADSKTIDCPKCGFTQAEGRETCLRCGVVFSKLKKAQDAVKHAAAALESLSELNGLAVRQSKDWSEAFIGFETSNSYTVFSPDGRELYQAAELEGSMLLRNLLKAMRPFQIQLRDSVSRQFVMQVSRPFRFLFPEVSVFGDRKKLLGTIKKEFSIVRRIYTVTDARGKPLFELIGPVFRPWTFEIISKGRKVGEISKQWSGLATELITDADNFGVTFPADLPVAQKSVLLGAVFLIDFVHFEDNNDD